MLDFENLKTQNGKTIKIIGSEKGKKIIGASMDQKTFESRVKHFIDYNEIGFDDPIYVAIGVDGQFQTKKEFEEDQKETKGKMVVVILTRVSDKANPVPGEKPCSSIDELLEKIPIMEKSDVCKICPIEDCADRKAEFNFELYKEIMNGLR